MRFRKHQMFASIFSFRRAWALCTVLFLVCLQSSAILLSSLPFAHASTPVDHFAIDNGFAAGSPPVAGVAFSLTIRAFNNTGNLVTDFNDQVTLTDITGTIRPGLTSNFSNGVWTGNVMITQSSNQDHITMFYGVQSTSSVDFQVQPDTRFTTLALVSGSNQSGVVASPLANPIVVKAIDLYGNPIPNATISFLIAAYPPNSANQSLTTSGATTDLQGRASTNLTLGTGVGTYTVTARVNTPNGQQLSIYENATAGAIQNIVLAPIITVVPKGSAQQFFASATDQFGNPILNVSPTWSVVNGGGSIDQNGVFTAGDTSGNFVNTIKAQIGSIGALATVTIINETSGTSEGNQPGSGTFGSGASNPPSGAPATGSGSSGSGADSSGTGSGAPTPVPTAGSGSGSGHGTANTFGTSNTY